MYCEGDLTIDLLNEAIGRMKYKMDALPDMVAVSPARYRSLLMLSPGDSMMQVASLVLSGAKVIESTILSDDEMVFTYGSGKDVRVKIIRLKTTD